MKSNICFGYYSRFHLCGATSDFLSPKKNIRRTEVAFPEALLFDVAESAVKLRDSGVRLLAIHDGKIEKKMVLIDR